jgi:hypothetical protein
MGKAFTQRQQAAITALETVLARFSRLGLSLYGVDDDLVVLRTEAVEIVKEHMDSVGAAVGEGFYYANEVGFETPSVEDSGAYIDSCAG